MIWNPHSIFVYLCMLKTKTTYKPTRLIEGYQVKKQLHGGFKIVEYTRMSNEDVVRKRTIYKNLTLTDAEDILYRLESKQK